MRALLFLAVFALATQVQMSEVPEFYRTFINNIPMDVETKNRIMNNGLGCINWATNIIANSAETIEHDIHSENIISALRHGMSSIQAFEDVVAPKCVQTYMELAQYLQEHQKQTNFVNENKFLVYGAALYQLMAKIFVDVLNKRPDSIAKDLAILISTSLRLNEDELPEILAYDPSKFVPTDRQKAVPEFLKGLFTGLGVTDLAKINATSQCVLDIFTTLDTISTNPAIQRGDSLTRAHAFLDSFMTVNDSLERCAKLDMVDMIIFKKLIQMFKQHPALSLFKVASNTILELPTVVASQMNVSLYMFEGQYELAGSMYAKRIRIVYDGLMF